MVANIGLPGLVLIAGMGADPGSVFVSYLFMGLNVAIMMAMGMN